jgi:hypothetical protein
VNDPKTKKEIEQLASPKSPIQSLEKTKRKKDAQVYDRFVLTCLKRMINKTVWTTSSEKTNTLGVTSLPSHYLRTDFPRISQGFSIITRRVRLFSWF